MSSYQKLLVGVRALLTEMSTNVYPMDAAVLRRLWCEPRFMDSLRRLPTTHDCSLDLVFRALGTHITTRSVRPIDVLEIACGSARFSLEVLRRFGRGIGIVRPSDINPAILPMLQPFHSERFRPLCLDATMPHTWPNSLNGHEVDVIVSHGALRYFHQELDVNRLRAWSSVLRPGGVVLFSDVNSRAFEVPSVFTNLRERLRLAGFARVETVSLTCRVFEMTKFYKLILAAGDLVSLDLDALIVEAGYREDSVFVLSARWGDDP